MKLPTKAIMLLLPTLSLATPLTENTNEIILPRAASEALVRCKIVSNDGPVKCRTGPGFSHSVYTTVNDGDAFDFSCYRKNTSSCYKDNCTWDKSGSCYINGYYTDNHCTIAALGLC